LKLLQKLNQLKTGFKLQFTNPKVVKLLGYNIRLGFEEREILEPEIINLNDLITRKTSKVQLISDCKLADVYFPKNGVKVVN